MKMIKYLFRIFFKVNYLYIFLMNFMNLLQRQTTIQIQNIFHLKIDYFFLNKN